MSEDMIDRARKARVANKIKKSVCSVYGISEITLGIDRRIAIDPKRAAVWAMYYYTPFTIEYIGEQMKCGHANVLYLIRTMNGLIESDFKSADKIVLLESLLKKHRLKKKNRNNLLTKKDGLKFATSYKKQTIKPVSTNKKVSDILLATNDKRIISSFLKAKREQIEQAKDVESVISLASEIKALEFQLNAL